MRSAALLFNVCRHLILQPRFPTSRPSTRGFSSSMQVEGPTAARRVAVGQMTATPDREANLRVCAALAEEARAAGALMLFLPECYSLVGNRWQDTVAAGQPLDGEFMTHMKGLARSNRLWLSLGGFPEETEGHEKVYNTHVIIDDEGALRAAYRKVHLFDVVRAMCLEGAGSNVYSYRSTFSTWYVRCVLRGRGQMCIRGSE
jgi:predicted amidohydrolase